jgi:hypothetical protein
MTSEEDRREHEEPTELERFLNLARKLVRVPKREIDAEQAKEDERKQDDQGNGHSLPVSRA